MAPRAVSSLLVSDTISFCSVVASHNKTPMKTLYTQGVRVENEFSQVFNFFPLKKCYLTM